MRAMVMAAGLGTRLRPITWEIPKPVVPVCNRPIVAQLARLLARHGATEVVANTHWFPETVDFYFGGECKAIYDWILNELIQRKIVVRDCGGLLAKVPP